MHLSNFASGATCLGLLAVLSPVHAQSNTANSQNLTLRFFPSSQETSCDYGNTGSALTFTTASIPGVSHCFDFADLFNGNATQGLVNQTANPGTTINSESGVAWSLQNADSFDSQANYSRVLYRQHVANAAGDEDKPGNNADRKVTLYGAKGCTESTGSDKDGSKAIPWFGFSCWSEDAGSCGTLPYGVVSFSVQAGAGKDDKDEQCWVFAEQGQQGAAAHVRASSQLMLGAFVSASVLAWLAL